MGRVIAVLSGKGGTGKTSVCAALALALAQSGKRVLCIDLDVGLRNLDIALGISDVPALPFTEVMNGSASLSAAAVHPDCPNLHFFTAPVGLTPEELDEKAFTALVLSARERFDYIFLDAPAGVGAGFHMAARAASTQLLVTGPEPASLRDGTRSGELLELMGKSDVRLVVNRVDARLYRDMGITVDDVMDMVGYPLLGLVPEDRSVTLAAVQGKNLLQYTYKGAAAALGRIARRLDGQRVPLKKL